MSDERAERLRQAVNRQAWHSGPGVPPHAICAAVVRELGITREMVRTLREHAANLRKVYTLADQREVVDATADAWDALLDAAGQP